MNQMKSGIGQRRPLIWESLTAALFSFFMVFGRAFENSGDWKPVLQNWPLRLLSAAQFLFWFALFFIVISRLFSHWDLTSGHHASQGPETDALLFENPLLKGIYAYASLLYQHPFRVTLLTLTIKNVPYFIVSYPGILMGDSTNQIGQVLGTTAFSNHHPVIHTMLIGLFLKPHELIGWNNCIFLYCLFQTVLLFLVLSACISTLVRMQTKKWITLSVLLFYLFQPRIENYLFLVSKDVIYSAFFTLFMLMLFRFLYSQETLAKSELFLFGFSIVGMVFFRNEGKYIVLGTLLLALLIKCKPVRKRAAAFLLLTLLASNLVSKVICPVLGAETTDIKELLSVPFQQTARYVLEYGDEVTEEERQAIDAVLDYGSLAEKYNPDLSDPVKGTYTYNNAALPDYFRTWFQMMLKHPGVYICATMANYYQYFYPGNSYFSNYSYNWSAQIMEKTNERTGLTDLSYPAAADSLRQTLESVRETYFKNPLLAVLQQPAVYVWLAILCIVYAIRGRSLVGFVFTAPMLIQILVFITGPTNGYYARYEFPMLIYLPVVLVLLPCIVQRDTHELAAHSK